MDFLVVGCGSIGQRHIRTLQALGHKVLGCEKDVSRRKKVGQTYGINVCADLNEALSQSYDGALVCTPTSLHIPQAIEIAKKGIHLFIEKPLANSLDRFDELSSIVAQKNLVVLVGCNTRFLPSLKLAKQLIEDKKIGKVLSVRIECGFYLPYWHPDEDYRSEYSANKSLGGGVIFDDIHELDSLYWLFGEIESVFCYADKISDLEIDTEDVAEIFLKLRSGAIAQIHLDYLQRTYRRSYQFIGEKGVIIWDYITQKIKLYLTEPNQWTVFQENINTDRDVMFLDELGHFVNCIKGKEQSINDLKSAKNVLKVALACHKSAQKKEIVFL